MCVCVCIRVYENVCVRASFVCVVLCFQLFVRTRVYVSCVCMYEPMYFVCVVRVFM